MRDAALSRELLDWYDRHARALPWRIGPAARAAGERPDPYRVWLSEIMLQQTTVAAVRDYYLAFTARWPCVHDLAAAEDADVMAAWAGLGYYARARNLLKCARVVSRDLDGAFPGSAAGLRALPGIGPYTAAAVAAIAHDEPAVVVDGNVERVMARMFAVETPLPAAKPELAAHAARLTPDHRPGCHAQAVMDLGATICTPKSPACGICPWRDPCAARMQGIAADLPRRSPKAAKPVRRGIAYVARRADGALLLERRPDAGLLGGMLGWPGSDWTESDPTESDRTGSDPASHDRAGAPAGAPPLEAVWRDAGAEVRHTFTHFHLRLAVMVAEVPQDAQPARGTFRTLDPAALPTLMKKVWAVAGSALLPD